MLTDLHTDTAGTDIAGTLGRLDALVSPLGVVARVSKADVPWGLQRVSAYTASIGSGSPREEIVNARGWHRVKMGAGHAVDSPELARLIAIAEAAERYSGTYFDRTPAHWATRNELRGEVLDLDRVPRCSEAELQRPGCPVAPLDSEARMRWTRGIRLSTGEPVWVPTTMASYRLTDRRPSERFWHQISTGYAVHSDPTEAIVRGICEVIERDMIAISWLQMLALPILNTGLSELTSYMIGWAADHFVETVLFDATSDLGVPTVYCVQRAPYDDRAYHVVGCATRRTLADAAESVLMETLFLRNPLHSDDAIPDSFDRFRHVTDGARFMGQRKHAPAFAHLFANERQSAVAVHLDVPPDPDDALAVLVGALEGSGMDAVVVERTTVELAAVGLTAVCVVVPGLQPMSLSPLAQFLAHPRLYSAPARMGYASHPERELNQWPQPFA